MIPDYEVQQIVNLLNDMASENDGWYGRAESAIKKLLDHAGIEIIEIRHSEFGYLERYEWKRKLHEHDVQI
jgi:hypothetical protein